MKTANIKPTRWLVACRVEGKNEIFEFATKADAVAFQRDCKARGIETLLSRWDH